MTPKYITWMWCISRLPEQGFRKTECMLAHVQHPFWETSLPLTVIQSVFHILPFTPRKSRKAGLQRWYFDIGKNRRLMAWSNFGKSWSFQLNRQNYVFLMMEIMCLKEKLTQSGRQKKYIQRDTSKVFRNWKNQREEPKVFHAGIRRPVTSRKLMKLVKYLHISNRNSRVTMK